MSGISSIQKFQEAVIAEREKVSLELQESGYVVIEETMRQIVFLYKGIVYLRLRNSNTWVAKKSEDGQWMPVKWAGHWIGSFIFKTDAPLNKLGILEEKEDIDTL